MSYVTVRDCQVRRTRHSVRLEERGGPDMVSLRDDLWIAVNALSAHKLRAALTVLGLTMGVATLMTVMTLVQGANL